jgi:signal transduction histidine kinase
MGNGWLENVHPDDRERCEKTYLKAFVGRENFTMECRLKRFDGEYRWMVNTGVPLTTSDTTFTGYIGSCIDITDRKSVEEILKRDKESLERLVDERSKELVKAQKELKQASRLADIGTLAATVAHELRNPLGVIQIAAHNLKRDKSGLLLNDRHILNIEKKVWEGNQIIDNLLSYSRIKFPRYEKVQLLAVLDECLAVAHNRFTDKTIKVERDYGSAPLESIEADVNQIREVFVNILNNAYQSFPEKEGVIRILVREHNGHVKVSIQDTGSGIAQEDLDKIFEPFFTRKSKGTGLGMTICNELIKLHQGRIEVESELGKGTTISVYLPKRKKTDEENSNHR